MSYKATKFEKLWEARCDEPIEDATPIYIMAPTLEKAIEVLFEGNEPGRVVERRERFAGIRMLGVVEFEAP